MSDLRELYQEVILDHNKSPRNFYPLASPAKKTEGYNPLCGDRLDLYLILENGTVKDISFEGSGCAISKASASLMTAVVKGKSVAEAEVLFEKFHRVVSGLGTPDDLAALGSLAVLSGVSEFPARVKCATLCWHTFRSGLANQPVK